MISKGDQHGLEDPDLRRGRPAEGDQPERQFAETHLAHQVLGQIQAEQPDVVGVGGAQRGGELSHVASSSQARISAPCSSRPGGG
jgi:hypothetical protein